MSNMSYCRFENTSRDLQDCYNALDEMLYGGEPIIKSSHEINGAKRLLETCRDIFRLLVDNDIVQEESLLDKEMDEVIDTFLEECKSNRDEEDDEDDDE